MTLPGVDPKRYEAEVARYKHEKEDIKKEAEKWEESSKEWNHKSDEAMHKHHQWALATTAEQIAISLAAITLLTRKKWMMGLAYGVAASASRWAPSHGCVDGQLGNSVALLQATV
jgi:deoxycytidine triphosphate deaminase